MSPRVLMLPLLLLLPPLAVTGCGLRHTPQPEMMTAAGYPGTLRPPSEIEGDFLARQRVEARYGETDFGFDAVLQKRGDRLTLLALTPFGTRAFVLEQTGTEISFRPFVNRELPFPPRYILIDIHRSLFIGLSRDPLPDGPHAGTRDGERITELWKDGRIVERTFEREDGSPPGTITVSCEGGMELGVPPPELRLDNGWFGYELEIRTTEYSILPPRG